MYRNLSGSSCLVILEKAIFEILITKHIKMRNLKIVVHNNRVMRATLSTVRHIVRYG